jgi:Trk K+ transport system NAD-binding subunit
VGDALIYIRIADAYENFSSLSTHLSTRSHPWQSLRQILKSWRSKWQEFWRLSREQQVQRVAIVCSFIVLLLLVIGTFLFHWTWADMTWLSAFSTTAILLLGGYADLFGELEEIEKIPPWLQLFSLALTLAGTAFVGVLYALLINALLSSRLQLGKSRPAIPSRNHVVVVGLDQIGQRVAKSLQEVKQPLVGITFERNEEADVLPEIPLVVGSPEEIFSHVNLTTAKSVVIVTNDEILNLEIALMVQKINPQSNLVIRTSGQRLAQHLHQLLPNAQVLDTYGAVAEVFAGAAFGENILYLFRLHNQTVLVTEYTIEAEDTLNNLLLAEVSYGYNVIPLLHQQKSGGATFMPSDDIRLEVGERLVVLATIYGLRRIEQGQMQPKQWQVRVESVLNDYGIFEGGNAIYRISGCPLSMARKLMKHLPATLPVKLYQHQGLRLVRALRKVQVKAHLEYCDQ